MDNKSAKSQKKQSDHTRKQLDRELQNYQSEQLSHQEQLKDPEPEKSRGPQGEDTSRQLKDATRVSMDVQPNNRGTARSTGFVRGKQMSNDDSFKPESEQSDSEYSDDNFIAQPPSKIQKLDAGNRSARIFKSFQEQVPTEKQTDKKELERYMKKADVRKNYFPSDQTPGRIKSVKQRVYQLFHRNNSIASEEHNYGTLEISQPHRDEARSLPEPKLTTINGQTHYPPYMQRIILSADKEIQQEFLRKLLPILEADQDMLSLVFKACYADLWKSCKVIDTIDKLLGQLKSLHQVDHVMEVICYCYHLFEELEASNQVKFAHAWFQDVVRPQLHDEDNRAQYLNLQDQQLQKFSRLITLVPAVNFLQQEKETIAGVLARLPVSVHDEIYAFFRDGDHRMRELLLKQAYHLTDQTLISFLCNNFVEYFQQQIICYLRTCANVGAMVHVLQNITDIGRQVNNLLFTVALYQCQNIKPLLTSLTTNGEVSLIVLKEVLVPIQSKMNSDVKFRTYIQHKADKVTTCGELQRIVDGYTSCDISVLTSAANKKITEAVKDQLAKKKYQDSTLVSDDALNVMPLKKTIDDYAKESKITPYIWQESIIAMLKYLVIDKKHNVVLELPTAHGKSVIISALAYVLLEHMGEKVDRVLVVLSTDFHTQYQHQHFAYPGQATGKFPDCGRARILYMQYQDFLLQDASLLNSSIVIFDEADHSLLSQPFRFTDKGPTKILAACGKLSECSAVIAFTGTLSMVALKHLETACQNNLLELRLPSVSRKQDNVFIQSITYDDCLWGDRDRVAADEIVKRFEKGSVIFIDEQLQPRNNSFLVRLHPELADKVHVFDDFSLANYDAYCHKLSVLADPAASKQIVHTSIDGMRGIDFKMPTPVHVVVGRHLTSSDEAEQSLGRGSRHYGQRSQGTLIVGKRSIHANLKPSQILEFLTNRDNKDALHQSLITRFLQVVHNSPADFKGGEDEKLEFAAIINERRPIHVSTANPCPNAIKNWDLLKAPFNEKKSWPDEQSSLFTKEVKAKNKKSATKSV